jgi:hypothetical protein
MTEIDISQPGPGAAGKSSSPVKKWRLILILLLLAAIAGMYAWKQVAVENTRKELTQKAGQIIADQNRAWLELLSVPLVWAVRSEMIRGNYDQINQYMINFVRQPNVNEVVLVKPDGVIMLATNKRLEGTPVADSFPASVLQVERTTVSPLEQRGWMSASPIMGINQKLGVIIFVYVPPEYRLQ